MGGPRRTRRAPPRIGEPTIQSPRRSVHMHRRWATFAIFATIVALATVVPSAYGAPTAPTNQQTNKKTTQSVGDSPINWFARLPHRVSKHALQQQHILDDDSSSSSSSGSGSSSGSSGGVNVGDAEKRDRAGSGVHARVVFPAKKRTVPSPTPTPTPTDKPTDKPPVKDEDAKHEVHAAELESSAVSFSSVASLPLTTLTPTPTIQPASVSTFANAGEDGSSVATVEASTLSMTTATAMATSSSSYSMDSPTTVSPPTVETPYRSTYCRCQANECQNEFPGESIASICAPPLPSGACSAGFSKCVSTSSYKVHVSPTTPNSVADVTFSLLAADVAGALHNLGEQNPLRDAALKWWLAFRLPRGWRFVAWGSTTLTVELAPTNDAARASVRQQLRVFPCEQITSERNCRSAANTNADDSDSVGFVSIQDMVADWKTFVATPGQAPLTFRLARSVVSGTSSTSNADNQVDVYIVYQSSPSSSVASRRRSRRVLGGVRELSLSASAGVVASGAGIAPGNLSVISLAKMSTPRITRGSLHSSMLWVEVQKKKATLSFSTSTIIGRNSNEPRICVNLRPPSCRRRGLVPTANVTWTATPSVTFANGGNPFVFFYETPDVSSMTLIQVNETFFCVGQLIPSGVTPNATWELHQPFRFQLAIEGVIWSSALASKNGTMADATVVPALAEISLTDRSQFLGNECSQMIVHEQPLANHGLSVYSVMSVTIYAVAFVGAVMITRMNGITFSASTFYNDMTSVCVVIVFLASIIGNTIWINVSGNGTATNASHIYYLTRILTACFSWTMITSVCFHWSTVLNHDVRQIRRVYLMFTFAAINAVFYAFGIFMLISMSDFFKCTYDDYLKNPKYDKRQCDTDYCPDLQPFQWRYAANQLCNAISYSNLYFVATFSMDVLMFLASVALLVLGTYVLRRGSRLIAHTGNLVDDRVVMAMRNSLKTYLVVILAITLSLGVSTLINIVLYGANLPMNAIVWYTLTIWLPTLIPPAGFLILQWNPRLHGTSWSGNPASGTSGDGDATDKTLRDTKADDTKKPFGRMTSGFGRLSDGWAGITDFPDTDYLPIGAETKEGPQQLLTLSTRFVTPVPIAQACYMELYVGEPESATADDFAFTVTGRAPRGSVNTMLQSGLLRESMIVQNTRDNSTLLHSMLTTNTSWVRAGVTETVTPTQIQDSNGQSAQVATFLSTVQIPNVSPTAMLRFVIYEVGGSRTSSTSSATSDRIGGAIHSNRSRRPSSGASRARVFCEFTCSSCEFVSVDEVRLVAPQSSHRGTQVAQVSGPSVPGPVLRVRCTTVSTRTLKESSGFYMTKCFQFADGDDMIVEDMTESIFTNEIPRQFLDLLQKDRACDLARAEIDLRAFQDKCKRGLATGLYDNLIDQIQGENVQAVAQSWLEERVRQRVAYIDALKECQRLCVNRAEEGINIKASTEKKSMLLRFLPINLHIQDMWVGPTAELCSQLLRRTSEQVTLYTGVTVGAFAAHGFKFRHGAGIISLRNRIVKKAPRRSASDRLLLSRIGSGLSEKVVEETFYDWTEAEVRAEDELKWHIAMRMDMCVSQALTALVATFCRNLEAALQHPSNHQFLHVVDSIGFLWQVESLLSTHGKELGMLEDFYSALEAMKGVSFVLDTAPAAHLPPTLNLHIKDLDLPSVVSVRLSGDSRSGTYTVVIGVRCSKETLEYIPASIRGGAKIPVTAVMFTQGINEMQTLANGSSAKKTTLQQTINHDNFLLLKEYVEKYKALACQVPGTYTTDLKAVENLLCELEEKIMAASKQMVKTKHPKIIQLSSRLCRMLLAGRVTSCKSAKDRTGMSVTLEQGNLLCDNHGLPQEYLARTVSTMRSNGVRLENAFKNTGKRHYAFNALQRSLLPEEYKCPEGTYGRGNVS